MELATLVAILGGPGTREISKAFSESNGIDAEEKLLKEQSTQIEREFTAANFLLAYARRFIGKLPVIEGHAIQESLENNGGREIREALNNPRIAWWNFDTLSFEQLLEELEPATSERKAVTLSGYKSKNGLVKGIKRVFPKKLADKIIRQKAMTGKEFHQLYSDPGSRLG